MAALGVAIRNVDFIFICRVSMLVVLCSRIDTIRVINNMSFLSSSPTCEKTACCPFAIHRQDDPEYTTCLTNHCSSQLYGLRGSWLRHYTSIQASSSACPFICQVVNARTSKSLSCMQAPKELDSSFYHHVLAFLFLPLLGLGIVEGDSPF